MTHPSGQARKTPPRSLRVRLMDFLTSPQLVLMTLAGIVLIVAVPYFAFRSIPGARQVLAPQPEPADPNAGMDFTVLETLPEDLRRSVELILASEEPRMPQPLIDLPEPSGFGLIYPVMETVEPLQVALSWNMFAPPPYRVVLKNAAGRVLASVQSLGTLSWLPPVQLERGARYSWEVTSHAGNETETAWFLVLDEPSVALWQQIRRAYRDSHLVLGLVAEELGMLTVAEREYQALIKAFPQAEAPARLLANVTALRDDSGAAEPQEVF